MTKYKQIIFVQGREANEALAIFDQQGYKEAISFLSQWDNDDKGEIREVSSAATADDVFTTKKYVLVVNQKLGYIGLERKIEE